MGFQPSLNYSKFKIQRKAGKKGAQSALEGIEELVNQYEFVTFPKKWLRKICWKLLRKKLEKPGQRFYILDESKNLNGSAVTTL